MLLYISLIKVIFYCNFVTCNSLLPNTADRPFNPFRIKNGTSLKWQKLHCHIIPIDLIIR